MPEVDEAIRVLEDGRYFMIGHRVPGTWFMQGFLSKESAEADEDPMMATADAVPDGRDYLTHEQAQALLDKLVPRFLEHWDEMRERLGVPAGATRRG